MIDPHTEARNAIKQAFCAAVLVRPLDPGLTKDEVREAALHLQVGPGALDEVLPEEWDRHRKDKCGRALAGSLDWDTFLSGLSPVPEDLVPTRVLIRLAEALVELDRQHGAKTPKTLAMIAAALDGAAPGEVEKAVGIMISSYGLERRGEGFVSQPGGPWRHPTHRASDEPHRWQAPLEQLVPILKGVLAKRTGEDAPETRPLDRFALWLGKQGWKGLASWWALTAKELDSLNDVHCPTAVCVLCGSLLEAALVAIAEPAMAAREWRQEFLKSLPDKWKLYDLIGQAEAAKTLPKDQAVDARTLADFRNRIHAGRFSAGGKPPFAPPHTNPHEAKLAKLHLDHLLDALLRWPPIATRASGGTP